MKLPSLLLVHGAWHGSWCWNLARPHFEDVGYRTIAVDLPSSGRKPEELGGLSDDASVIESALSQIDPPVVIMGHSYGGIPMAQAARPERVSGMVFLSACVLPPGESLLTMLGGLEPPWLRTDTAGSCFPENPEALFYHDVPPDLVEWAVSQLKFQSIRSFREPLTGTDWRAIPSAYVVCADDRALFPELQLKMAAECDFTLTIPGSHSPFLSRPADLVKVVDVAIRRMHGIALDN